MSSTEATPANCTHAAEPPTRDIDVTPRATPANLGRLSQALTDLDAPIRKQGPPGLGEAGL